MLGREPASRLQLFHALPAFWRVSSAFTLALALVGAACGGSDDDAATLPANSGPEPAAEQPANEPGDEAGADPLEAAEDLAEDIEEAQSTLGGGGFTLTIGDDTWTFDSLLCAFGEEQIGQEGAEFVLSSIQDGLQAYVSIDTFGYSVSVDDISDFQNPSVSYSTFQDATIDLDGKSVGGEGLFVDGTADGFTEIAGTFSGTCP